MRRTSILLVHLFFILTPIFAGWGLKYFDEFFHQPVRALFVAAILLGGLAVLLLRIDLNPLRTGSPASNSEAATLLALSASAIVLLFFLAYADRRHVLTIDHMTVQADARWLGLILTICAGIVRVLALRQLGSQFSAYVTLQPNHKLIQTGIYAHIRHPLYLSLLLAGPGVALIFASQLVWPVLAAAAVFIADRIAKEDAMLRRAFPDHFSSYRSKTDALFPKIR